MGFTFVKETINIKEELLINDDENFMPEEQAADVMQEQVVENKSARQTTHIFKNTRSATNRNKKKRTRKLAGYQERLLILNDKQDESATAKSAESNKIDEEHLELETEERLSNLNAEEEFLADENEEYLEDENIDEVDMEYIESVDFVTEEDDTDIADAERKFNELDDETSVNNKSRAKRVRRVVAQKQCDKSNQSDTTQSIDTNATEEAENTEPDDDDKESGDDATTKDNYNIL